MEIGIRESVCTNDQTGLNAGKIEHTTYFLHPHSDDSQDCIAMIRKTVSLDDEIYKAFIDAALSAASRG